MAPSSTWRWLAVLASSLLIVEVARRATSSDSADQTLAAEAALSSTAATAAAAVDSLPAAAAVVTPAAPPTDSIYDPLPIGTYNTWVADWDGLEAVPDSIDPKSGRPIYVTRHLIFIRHGQYVLPRNGDRTDPVLTALGREQARLTGKRLASLGMPISVIHCSTMARAHETATLIGEAFPSVPVAPTDLLREGVPCAHVPQHPTWFPSEQSKAEEPPRIKAAFEHYVKRWRQDEYGRQIESLEQWREMEKRLALENGEIPGSNTLTRQEHNKVVPPTNSPATGSEPKNDKAAPLSTSTGTISLDADSKAAVAGASLKAKKTNRLPPIHLERYELVVCHGNVIRYSLLRALQLPVQAWLRLAIYNTGISHIYVKPDGAVSLRSLGDTGHLAPDQITYH